MSEPKFPARPWGAPDFDEYAGYDGMSAGVTAGPALLDGTIYGQRRCQAMSDEAKVAMMADAHLISAAPDMFAALEKCVEHMRCVREGYSSLSPEELARAVLAKAKGETP